MTVEIPEAIREYLTSGMLLQDVKDYLDRLIVGEETNKLLLYLLLLQGQSIIVKGDSSTGKNTLVDKTLQLFPDDEVVTVSSITAKSLRWLERDSIGIFYIKELPYEEVQSTFSPFALDLKQVISDKVLTPMFVETGEDTPRTRIRRIRIYSVIQTTLEYDLPEDIENRVWILSTDNSANQTKRVCEYKGLLREVGAEEIIDFELLKDLKHVTEFLFRNKWRVVIPKATKIAAKLAELYPVPRLRRDIDKIFDLIEAVARTHGRTVATTDDIKLAFKLAAPTISYMFRYIDPRLEAAYKTFVEIEDRQVYVTSSDFAKELGVSQTDARRKIRALINAGLIEEVGRGERGIRLYKSLKQLDKFDFSIIDEILSE